MTTEEAPKRGKNTPLLKGTPRTNAPHDGVPDLRSMVWVFDVLSCHRVIRVSAGDEEDVVFQNRFAGDDRDT